MTNKQKIKILKQMVDYLNGLNRFDTKCRKENYPSIITAFFNNIKVEAKKDLSYDHDAVYGIRVSTEINGTIYSNRIGTTVLVNNTFFRSDALYANGNRVIPGIQTRILNTPLLLNSVIKQAIRKIVKIGFDYFNTGKGIAHIKCNADDYEVRLFIRKFNEGYHVYFNADDKLCQYNILDSDVATVAACKKIAEQSSLDAINKKFWEGIAARGRLLEQHETSQKRIGTCIREIRSCSIAAIKEHIDSIKPGKLCAIIIPILGRLTPMQISINDAKQYVVRFIGGNEICRINMDEVDRAEPSKKMGISSDSPDDIRENDILKAYLNALGVKIVTKPLPISKGFEILEAMRDHEMGGRPVFSSRTVKLSDNFLPICLTDKEMKAAHDQAITCIKYNAGLLNKPGNNLCMFKLCEPFADTRINISVNAEYEYVLSWKYVVFDKIRRDEVYPTSGLTHDEMVHAIKTAIDKVAVGFADSSYIELGRGTFVVAKASYCGSAYFLKKDGAQFPPFAYILNKDFKKADELSDGDKKLAHNIAIKIVRKHATAYNTPGKDIDKFTCDPNSTNYVSISVDNDFAYTLSYNGKTFDKIKRDEVFEYAGLTHEEMECATRKVIIGFDPDRRDGFTSDFSIGAKLVIIEKHNNNTYTLTRSGDGFETFAYILNEDFKNNLLHGALQGLEDAAKLQAMEDEKIKKENLHILTKKIRHSEGIASIYAMKLSASYKFSDWRKKVENEKLQKLSDKEIKTAHNKAILVIKSSANNMGKPGTHIGIITVGRIPDHDYKFISIFVNDNYGFDLRYKDMIFDTVKRDEVFDESGLAPDKMMDMLLGHESDAPKIILTFSEVQYYVKGGRIYMADSTESKRIDITGIRTSVANEFVCNIEKAIESAPAILEGGRCTQTELVRCLVKIYMKSNDIFYALEHGYVPEIKVKEVDKFKHELTPYMDTQMMKQIHELKCRSMVEAKTKMLEHRIITLLVEYDKAVVIGNIRIISAIRATIRSYANKWFKSTILVKRFDDFDSISFDTINQIFAIIKKYDSDYAMRTTMLLKLFGELNG